MGAKNSRVISRVKKKLTTTFEMVDMGLISFYIGLKVSKNREKKMIKLSQPIYINKILTKFHLSQGNTSNTPKKKTLLELSEKSYCS